MPFTLVTCPLATFGGSIRPWYYTTCVRFIMTVSMKSGYRKLIWISLVCPAHQHNHQQLAVEVIKFKKYCWTILIKTSHVRMHNTLKSACVCVCYAFLLPLASCSSVNHSVPVDCVWHAQLMCMQLLHVLHVHSLSLASQCHAFTSSLLRSVNHNW